MLVIGLTGGIGSGKTAASDYFETLGITVVDADKVARQVVEPGQPALHSIVEHFGQGVLQKDGTLNRRALRKIVFADAEQRKALEAITHPAIGSEIHRQITTATSAYVILVSPLLLETSQRQMVNRVLLIDVPERLQIERTRLRDEVPESQVKAIIQAQMQADTRRQQADDIVVNDGSLEALHKTLATLHQQYLEMTK